MTKVIAIGGSGGGGGGNRRPATDQQRGGAGGGGAMMVEQTYRSADLGATETVSIGVGGPAGAGATIDGADGGNGGGADAVHGCCVLCHFYLSVLYSYIG